MHRTAFVLALSLAAAPALAQDPPTYHRVVGVAQDDVLNIRAEPGGSADIIGEFAPGAGPIEVGALDETGNWGRVIFFGETGWVSTAFLEEMEVERLPDHTRDGKTTGLPLGLFCSGTEPFWHFVLDGPQSLTFSNFDHEDLGFEITFAAGASGRLGLPAMLEAENPESGLVASVHLGTCSDGMSDATFAMGVTMLIDEAMGRTVLEGCCQLGLEE